MKNNKNQNSIKLFQEIVTYMETNLEKWNSIEEIRRTYDEFTHNLKKINDLLPELDRDLSPVMKELEDKRDLLMQKLFPLVNILEVYAEDHKMGKKTLALLIPHKKLESLSNKDFLSQATRLHKRIDKYMNRVEGEHKSGEQINPGQDIKRYGLTQFMMDELHSACNQYESALYLRKDVLIYRSRTRKKLKALILENRKLLKNRLNKLMTVFSGTHTSFYQNYIRISTH